MAIQFPANASAGTAHFHNNRTWTFNGTKWLTSPIVTANNVASTVVANVQPTGDITAGTIWLNNQANTTQIYNGTTWANVGGGSGNIFVSATQPNSTTTGTLWFDSTTSALKVYDGNVWAQSVITATQLDLGSEALTLPSGNTDQRPVSAVEGMIRYNIDITTSEMYVGANGWSSLATVVPPPEITTVSPSTYNGESGTNFTITGLNFTSDAVVSFITNSLTQYTAAVTLVVSDTELQATTPQDFTVADGPLTVKVVQSSGQVLQSSAISTGNAPVWSTLTGSLGTKYEGESLSIQLAAPDADAGATVTFTKTTGTLPTGVTLNSSGVISGIVPQTDNSTTYSFTVRATDNAGNYSDRNFSITCQPAVITWTTTAGSIGTTAVVGSSYSTLVAATASASLAVTYSVQVGTLPTGLSLNSSTGAITGTPSGSVGPTTFTIRASTTYRTSDRQFSITVDSLVAATGGTVATSGNFKYHTFTGSGTFTVTQGGNVSVMMVGGGGGAGSGGGGGGGGAGGYVYKSVVAVSAQGYTITIGSGGAGAASTSAGPPYGSDGVVKFASTGGNTTAFGFTAAGGGAGGSNNAGTIGASGGGGASNQSGASGNQGTLDADGFGNSGAAGSSTQGGGGGGAGAGASGVNGGDGKTYTGMSAMNLAGGGYGGNQAGATGTSTYGGGYGGNNGTSVSGSSGATNTGGGGGGGYTGGCCYGFYMSGGGQGGDGIVIIKYATSF